MAFIKKNEFYPIAGDSIKYLPNGYQGTNRPMAKWTGETRNSIKKGEWFLSGGGPIAAYYAMNDLDFMNYHIAELYHVKRISTIVPVKRVE